MLVPLVVVVAASASDGRCQQSGAKDPKAFRCEFPREETVSRQLHVVNGRDVESPVGLTFLEICDEQRRELESAELLNGDPDIKVLSRYDERGNEIEHEYYVHGSLSHSWIARYDNSSRMIQTVYNDGGKVVCVNGRNRSSCKLFGTDGKVTKRWVTSYNSGGREIQKLEFDPVETLKHRYLYGYDSWGRRNLEVDYYRVNGKRKTSRNHFTFDQKGRFLKKLWYNEKGLRSREVFSYNPKGDLVKRTEYDVDDSVVEKLTRDYQSDDTHGNWNKAFETRVRTQKGQTRREIRRVMYRTITYSTSTIAFLRK